MFTAEHIAYLINCVDWNML